MTTISFTLDNNNAIEIPQLSKILKALGAKTIKIKEEEKDDSKMTKEAYFAMIDEAKKQYAEGKYKVLKTEEDINKLFADL